MMVRISGKLPAFPFFLVLWLQQKASNHDSLLARLCLAIAGMGFHPTYCSNDEDMSMIHEDPHLFNPQTSHVELIP